MSHPLLVEAIETAFVPLAIQNNRPGRDAEVLRRYEEPAWNNPVVRFFAPGGRELLERRDRVWSEEALAARLVAALEAAGEEVPAYLALAREELSGGEPGRAVFAMHCFWQGEASLGALPGVRSTRVGWLAGREVVEVRYDPARLAYGELVRAAQRLQCSDRIFATTEPELEEARGIVGERAELERGRPRDAKPSDEKYHLKRSAMHLLPLTPLQATRANALLAKGGDALAILSPRQRQLLRRIEVLLARDPGALDGLDPPRDLEGLAAYARRLEAKLSAVTPRKD